MIDTPNKSEAVRQRGRCLLTPRCSLEIVLATVWRWERAANFWSHVILYVLLWKESLIANWMLFTEDEYSAYITSTQSINHSVHIVLHCYTLHIHCIHVYDDIISPQRQFAHSLSPHTGFTNRIRSQHFEAKVAQDSIAEAKAKSEAESKALESHIKWVLVSFRDVQRQIIGSFCCSKRWGKFRSDSFCVSSVCTRITIFSLQFHWNTEKVISIRLIPLRQN